MKSPAVWLVEIKGRNIAWCLPVFDEVLAAWSDGLIAVEMK